MGPRLLSINVGLPRDVSWQGRVVRTSVWKEAVSGPRLVRHLNIDGDGQGDRTGHGGEHRAICVYQIESYRYWENELGRSDFVYGQFGENFTIEGLPDREVCIGDRYRIGGALFEVTQPRVTCYRVGVRMDNPRMAALLVEHQRPGFYFRVLEEGEVEAGDEIVQVQAGPEKMSVSEIDALLYLPGKSRHQLERALRVPALSAGWRGSFRSLLAEDASERDSSPAWPGFRAMRVSSKIRESASVTSLTLEPTDDVDLPAPLPGQFVVLRLTLQEGAPPQMRSYSLSGDPSQRRYRISVKQEPHGAASGFIANKVQIGDLVEISTPRGDFTLPPGDAPVVLLSAGIGATPLLAMLYALAKQSAQREVWWVYAARNGREHPFAAEVQRLLTTMSRSHRHICYSAASAEDCLGTDFEASGRLDMAALDGVGLPPGADCFVCGPASFMSDITAGLAASGVPREKIHTEAFGAKPSMTPGVVTSASRVPHAPATLSDSGPMVSFVRSGLNVRWGSRFQSLLELAEACDVPTRWACRTGVCHTCETALVAGTVAYSPDPLTPPAPGAALICCSRPTSNVVIDL